VIGRAVFAWVAFAVLASAGTAFAQSSAGGEEAAREWRPSGLVELKRQATARGTAEETTKTNLKLDWFPEGTVSLLRLELPFPDEKSDFAGDPLDPEFGDAKIRVGFRAIEVAGRPWTSFAELTFPTADPESQGTGKYQFSGGVKTTHASGSIGPVRQSFSAQLQQVVSFAGDAARKDINQTKIELEWRGTWGPGHFAKATAKPVVDWVDDGKTGAVLEIEGGWWVNREWTMAVLAGGLLWGKGVPGTYETRGELKLIRRF
jgi:hypothetical protein